MNPSNPDPVVEMVVRRLIRMVKQKTVGDTLLRMLLVHAGGELVVRPTEASTSGKLEVSQLADGSSRVRLLPENEEEFTPH